jgi:hypothetical protein
MIDKVNLPLDGWNTLSDNRDDKITSVSAAFTTYVVDTKRKAAVFSITWSYTQNKDGGTYSDTKGAKLNQDPKKLPANLTMNPFIWGWKSSERLLKDWDNNKSTAMAETVKNPLV